MTCINFQLNSIELPPEWSYDPGWTWPGTEAAIYHDTYWATLEDDPEKGYIIEVKDESILLYEIDNGNNFIIGEKDRGRDELKEAIQELITQAETRILADSRPDN